MKREQTILIVEDEQDLREALRDVLSDNHYGVLEAVNGKEGVVKALKEQPDLILLDLLMPEMDGMTALAEIRKNRWGKNALVIILTNLNPNKEKLIEDVVTHKPLEYLIKSDWKISDVLQQIQRALA